MSSFRPDEAETRSTIAPLQCHYRLFRGDDNRKLPSLTIALHGYGSNPGDMLRLTQMTVGREHPIVAIRAPHPLPEGYCWGMPRDWGEAIELHQSMVGSVAKEAGEMLGIPAERRVLLGFSQPVGLNYRFLAAHPDSFGGVVAVCGGIPGGWEQFPCGGIETPILHISRDRDEYYPEETARTFPDRLRVHASDVEFHMLAGPHRFPSKAAEIVRPWLQRVFGED